MKDAAAGSGRGMSGGIKGISRMLPFTVARAIVRNLKLKGYKEWQAWSKAGQRPSNIPGCPHQTYRDEGWISYPDWLGYEYDQHASNMLAFAVARAIVRKLKLKGEKEWRAWSSSGQRPSNIPAGPHNMYRDDGWISYPDWLGYGSEGGNSSTDSSSLSSSSTSATQKKTKKKRKRRVKTKEPHPSDASGDATTANEPPPRKIKKEDEKRAY